jgi:hypothetical protein
MTVGSINRKMTIKVCLGIKRDPLSKINKAKRAGGVAQVVEHLPHNCEALNSNPNTHSPQQSVMKKDRNEVIQGKYKN